MAIVVVGVVWLGFSRMNKVKNESCEAMAMEFMLNKLRPLGFGLEKQNSETGIIKFSKETTFLINKNKKETGYEFKASIMYFKGTRGIYCFGVPISYGRTGKRTFYIDPSGVIRGSDNNGKIADIYVIKTWPEVDVGSRTSR